MSVVVAIKKDGIIYLGCDSQVTRGSTRSTLTNPNNYKIWKVKNVPNCLMGSVGALRDQNVVRIMNNLVTELDILHNEINFEFVVSDIVPHIIHELRSYDYYSKDGVFDAMDSRFIFCYKDQCFVIGNDGAVIEVDDKVAIGSGESEAIGSLLSTEDELDIKSRIRKAIKATACHDLYVDYPIIISNTNDCVFETFFDEK